jgi:hypothetical protein
MRKMTSRRTHKRYNVKDGAFAVLFQNSSKLGQIIDISVAGFSFRYSDSQFIDNDRDGQAFLYHDNRKQMEGFSKFDIFLVDSGIYLDKIPCKIISDFEIDDQDSPYSIPTKRCCIQFDELVPEQITDLKFFIKNCTSDSD